MGLHPCRVWKVAAGSLHFFTCRQAHKSFNKRFSRAAKDRALKLYCDPGFSSSSIMAVINITIAYYVCVPASGLAPARAHLGDGESRSLGCRASELCGYGMLMQHGLSKSAGRMRCRHDILKHCKASCQRRLRKMCLFIDYALLRPVSKMLAKLRIHLH